MSIYPKESKGRSQRNICTLKFIAWFTIAKIRKQSKSPLSDEWINKMCSIHIMGYYLALKKRKYHAKWNQSVTESQKTLKDSTYRRYINIRQSNEESRK